MKKLIKKYWYLLIIIIILVIGLILYLTNSESEYYCAPITGGGYTLILDTNGGESIDNIIVCVSCAPDSYEDIPDPIKTGYTFDGWYYDEEFTKLVESKSTYDIEKIKKENIDGCTFGYEDITLYAKWK